MRHCNAQHWFALFLILAFALGQTLQSLPMTGMQAQTMSASMGNGAMQGEE